MIGVSVDDCQSITMENKQDVGTDDKHLWHSDWLSSMLKTDLEISDEDIIADIDKSEHSFVRNLLTQAELNQTLYKSNRRPSSIAIGRNCNTAGPSVMTPADGNLPDCYEEFSDITSIVSMQTEQNVSDSVSRPEEAFGNGRKRAKLRCQLTRTNSTSDRTPIEDSADSLLKTPAGFYDRMYSYSSSGVAIPPLFDYSSDLVLSTSPSSSTSYMLSSIVEDEKCSDGSEISSTDIDMVSVSAASPTEFADERRFSIPLEGEIYSPQQEDRVVLSVLQNVLSDEAATLNAEHQEAVEVSSEEPVTESKSCEHEIVCSKQDQQVPELSSMDSHPVVNNPQLSMSSDTFRLNPLAKPFSCVQPVPPVVPLIITSNVPAVSLVPVNLAYTRLVPVAVPKSSPSSRRQSKAAPAKANNTPAKAITTSSKTDSDSQSKAKPLRSTLANYQYATYPAAAQVPMYYYYPMQPAYYLRPPYFPLVAAGRPSSAGRGATLAPRLVRATAKKESLKSSDSSQEALAH